jgi:hypothetical protein
VDEELDVNVNGLLQWIEELPDEISGESTHILNQVKL